MWTSRYDVHARANASKPPRAVRGAVLDIFNRGFARRGTHLYAHDFARLLGFLFVLRGMEKNNKTRCYEGFTL